MLSVVVKLLAILAIALQLSVLTAYQTSIVKVSLIFCNRASSTLNFEKNQGSATGNQKKGFLTTVWQGLERFLSGGLRARFEKSYATPLTATPRFRYHIRIVRPEKRDKRHIIDRIMRYFPDVSFGGASEIVETGLSEGIALLRVLSNKVSYYCIKSL